MTVDKPGAAGNPIRADITQDSNPDTRWLSYREIAEILAPTKVESVIRLVRRKGWPKRDSNNGVRVAVPADVLADMQARRHKGLPPTVATAGDVLADIPADNRADTSQAVAALEAALAVLRGELASTRSDQAKDRAEWAQQLAAVRAELDKTRAEVVDQRSRADRAEGVIEGLRAQPAGGFAAWWQSVRVAFRS